MLIEKCYAVNIDKDIPENFYKIVPITKNENGTAYFLCFVRTNPVYPSCGEIIKSLFRGINHAL